VECETWEGENDKAFFCLMEIKMKGETGETIALLMCRSLSKVVVKQLSE
jgi:hypothetical protein